MALEDDSIAVDIIRSIARGENHRGECPAAFPSMHLHEFVRGDGRMRCFLRELANYIEAAERAARKDRL